MIAKRKEAKTNTIQQSLIKSTSLHLHYTKTTFLAYHQDKIRKKIKVTIEKAPKKDLIKLCWSIKWTLYSGNLLSWKLMTHLTHKIDKPTMMGHIKKRNLNLSWKLKITGFKNVIKVDSIVRMESL